MGDLVLLPHRIAPARSFGVGESAAILFFTGVRYQRWDADKSAPVPAVKKRRRSKKAKANRLELHA